MYLRIDEIPPVPDERWWGDHLRETRWALELSRLLADPVFHGRGVTRGDGRPVILMPGFGGGDYTLLVLAAWLKRIGYEPHTAGFVTNTGCSDRGLDRVERRALQLHRRHGRRVALIGHSRGGHYVRALGHRRPELVSHGISIGAGLRQMLATSYPTQAAAGAARRVALRSGRSRSPQCLTEGCDCPFAADFAGPFPIDRVRLTSIYSKGDGVVRWQSALVPYGTCVEVTGSHVGLIFNRKTYRAIAAALAEPELEDPHADRAR
ncbi:MAG TPA: alpha/beta hydrolase [Solirubrobacteraceae bacterium]|nr:alpha/beta hydrolase [Solirubrobacteraceae bacterium]